MSLSEIKKQLLKVAGSKESAFAYLDSLNDNEILFIKTHINDFGLNSNEKQNIIDFISDKRFSFGSGVVIWVD